MLRPLDVYVTVKDRAGNSVEQLVNVIEKTPVQEVMGGYYASGNGVMTRDIQGMNIKSFTQYHSFAEPVMIPGYEKEYLKNLHARGIVGNYVCELKHYGNSNTGSQSMTLEGIRYTVPAPNMLIQKRPGTTFPKAYGYEQVWSGQCDGLLHKLAIQLRNMGGAPINVQLASEFDTDHEFGTTEGTINYTWEQADARAVRALKYMIDFIKTKNIPNNVTFSVGMGGFDRNAFKRMHPEDLMIKVNYMQYNAYRRAANVAAYDMFKRTKAWIDADLGAVAKSKNIIIAEWGSQAALKDQANFLETVPEAVTRLNNEAKTGRIVMMNYFNSGWGLFDPSAAGLAALKGIYAQEPFTA